MLDVIRRWSPAPVKGLYRSLRGRLRPTWSGVYAGFGDVPVRGAGFDGIEWSRMTRENTEAALRSVAAGRGSSAHGDRSLLPALVAKVGAPGRSVAILDFGGGMGIGYLDVRAALGRHAPVRYTVLEVESVCVHARPLFAEDPSISFISRIEDAGEAPLDILYICSALQYVKDWRGLMRRLLAFRPTHVLFANVSAGAIPTYATAQLNLRGSVLAYWFLGLDDLTELLRGEGYELRESTSSDRRLVGLAVPKTHRIDRGSNLLFARPS